MKTEQSKGRLVTITVPMNLLGRLWAGGNDSSEDCRLLEVEGLPVWARQTRKLLAELESGSESGVKEVRS